MNIEGLVLGKPGSSDNVVVSHSSQAAAENSTCGREDCSEENQIPYICRHNHARAGNV